MIGPAMPRGLLVSVRDTEEALEALAGGAAIVDVKEPSRGPLGRADAVTAAAIGRALHGRVPWTLACGELAAVAAVVSHVLQVLEHLGSDAPPPLAVKAGPAAIDLDGWQAAQRRMADSLPEGIAAVAVAYADWERADAPPPEGSIDAAAAAGAGVLLIDTFDKSAGGLFEPRSSDVVAGWVGKARASGLRVALAGRLRARHVPLAAKLGADVVAVRSAACGGDRMGRVESARVRDLDRLWSDGVSRREPLHTGGTDP